MLLGGRVIQEVLSQALRVGSPVLGGLGRLWHSRPWRPTSPDEHSQHLTIFDSGVLEGLQVGVQGAAVEVEGLGGGGEGVLLPLVISH